MPRASGRGAVSCGLGGDRGDWGGFYPCGGAFPSPVYVAPVYVGPVYVGPVYVAPAYVAPVYVAPVYVGPGSSVWVGRRDAG